MLGEVVDQQLVRDLPLNGRDFGKLVALVPGATVEPSGVAAIQSGFGQFSINGSRDRSNNYALDGTDNNDPFFNNSAFNQTGIGGAPASILPIDAIQEFNLQSQFGAEYGRNSGSVVNIITKSGTNHLHGSAFEFLRNDAMDARNFFNREPAPRALSATTSSVLRWAGRSSRTRLSSLVRMKDSASESPRTSAFWCPLRRRSLRPSNLVTGNGIVPSQALTNMLALFPSDPPRDTSAGSVEDKNDVDSFIAKLDHQFSSNESLTGRYAFARSQQVFPLGGLGFGAGSRLPQFAQTSPTRVQLVSASLLSTLWVRQGQ